MISAMSGIYAMQRANGDWFALEEREKFRVPVFSSNSEAMRARAFNVEMLVFKPVLLDERALKDLAPTDGDRPASSGPVNKASTSMKRGVAFGHARLAELIRGGCDERSMPSEN